MQGLLVAGALVVLIFLFDQQSGGTVTQAITSLSWPSGDAIWDIARAIAKQEGFGASSSNAPTRNHNPGDISDGARTFGHDPKVTDSQVTSFPDDATGWQWLYSKLSNVASGASFVYGPQMTWIEIGASWAGDPGWPYGVAQNLGVDPESTMQDYLDSHGWQG
jgi:hypothetical protein